MKTTASSKTIEVYVRLGNGPEDPVREMSIRNVPPEITQKALLDFGFAFDGNAAVSSVSAYTDDDTGRYVPLAEALREEQRGLVEWFGTFGYEVMFK